MENQKLTGFLRTTFLGVLVLVYGVGCQGVDTRHQVLVSASEQKMVVLDRGEVVKEYPVSTSKYGLGDQRGSYRTPTGRMVIAKKIGDGAPKGAVFKSRQWTGEVLPADAPGRDPVLTRILWLKGREPSNRNTFGRLIYIHGTTEERNIGRPVSYGCIRMKSDDVLDLYHRVGVGTTVTVLPGRMPMAVQTASLRKGMRNAFSNGGAALASRKPVLTPESVRAEAEPMPIQRDVSGGDAPSTTPAAPEKPTPTTAGTTTVRSRTPPATVR